MIIVYILIGAIGGLTLGALLLRWQASRKRKYNDDDDLIVEPTGDDIWPDGIEEITHVDDGWPDVDEVDEEDGAMQDDPGGQGG